MVILSKHQLLRDFPFIRTCHPLHISGNPSCIKNALLCFLHAARACSKYYIPVYLLQFAFVGVKNMNREKVLRIFLGYFRSILYGATFPLAAIGTACLYRLCFGIVNVKTFLTIGLTMGATIFCESKRNRQLNTYMISTVALENVVNELETLKLITRSPLRDTLKFMAVNGLVMYFLAWKKLESLNFWFYDVEPIKVSDENSPQCMHKDNCLVFFKEGFKKYFLIGYGWNIIKLFMKNSSKMIKRPRAVPFYFVKLGNFKFGSSLGLYAVIYRCVMCNLRKIDGVQSARRWALHSGVAGMLAASTYIIEPNLQFGLTAFVTLLQIFYERLKASTFDEKVWAKVPGAEILFIVIVSYINICYFANTVEMQRANCSFIWETFSGNITKKFQTVIFREMKLIP